MMYSDQDASEDFDQISERYFEWKGRGFKLVCMDPHGYWKVHHATNNKPMAHLQGQFTSLNEAIKALKAVPEELLPPIRKMKTVLTPRIKDEEDED